MSSQQYLEIFNPAPKSYPDFHQFSRFPAEIRCLVWEQALSHERWVRVKLEPGLRDSDVEDAPKPDYEIYVHMDTKISKLFRITRESRRVALRFYRVQLPCRYFFLQSTYSGAPAEEGKKGIIYLCPELDILSVSTMSRIGYLARDMWDLDPRRVGLVNLAAGIMTSQLGADQVMKKLGTSRQLLKQALSRVERFTIMEDRVPRAWTGDYSTPTRWRSNSAHRACPLNGNTVAFERLPYDPRLEEKHLMSVYTGEFDAREGFREFRKLLTELDVIHDHVVDYRFGLCSRGWDNSLPHGTDRVAAAEWLRKQEETFESILQDSKQRAEDRERSMGRELPPDHGSQYEQHLHRVPQQAIGFWLFSLKSLGAKLEDF
ncbi:hypothetical protein LB507_007912 [Fusarium sp. FIESC RH6]|nr:hypothetical protein LB507_007912 [Fusarium sp. FIESC RH6]